MKYLNLALIFTISIFAACQNVATNEIKSTKTETVTEIKQISVTETNDIVKKENVQFVDVRTVSEFKSGHAPKAINIPLDALEKELTKLDKDKPIYLICQTGRRSQNAAEILKNSNFKQIYNVIGGTSAWTSADLPLE